MSTGHLVTMANDIANFFAAESDRAVAVEGVLNHLRKFWDPRMRRKIVAHLHESGGAGLGDLAREAVAQLAQVDAVAAGSK